VTWATSIPFDASAVSASLALLKGTTSTSTFFVNSGSSCIEKHCAHFAYPTRILGRDWADAAEARRVASSAIQAKRIRIFIRGSPGVEAAGIQAPLAVRAKRAARYSPIVTGG
jgi:hypothetical protein